MFSNIRSKFSPPTRQWCGINKRKNIFFSIKSVRKFKKPFIYLRERERKKEIKKSKKFKQCFCLRKKYLEYRSFLLFVVIYEFQYNALMFDLLLLLLLLSKMIQRMSPLKNFATILLFFHIYENNVKDYVRHDDINEKLNNYTTIE